MWAANMGVVPSTHPMARTAIDSRRFDFGRPAEFAKLMNWVQMVPFSGCSLVDRFPWLQRESIIDQNPSLPLLTRSTGKY